jgi:hypothetical protein
MPSRGRRTPTQAERSPLVARRFVRRFWGLTALGVLTGACSFTSLDGYFLCKPGHKDCQDPAAGTGNTAGGAGGQSASGSAGVAAGGLSGNGLAGEGGNAGQPGAAPGEFCMADTDCAVGVCSLQVCGDSFEVIYADTPDSGDTAKSAKWIKFTIQITNRTEATVALNSLKVHYYYTPESVTSELQVLSAGDPPGDDTLVTGTFDFTQEPGTKHWEYLEVGFTTDAGNLKSDQTTGVIKVGIHDMDFGSGTFFQTGDYSYKQPTHVTVYYDDKLVSGIEPTSPPP